MDQEQVQQLSRLITEILKRNLSQDAYNWLQDKSGLLRNEKSAAALNEAFSAIPRKTLKKTVEITAGEHQQVNILCRGYSLNGWAIDRLARLWLLMQIDASDKDLYLGKIEALFKNAEMNEQVALYSALPVYAYPESWIRRTAEGIRSNIALVLEAIMYNNPFPSKYLEEAAWNQLVLKAFFTEKDVNKIIGIDERANQRLADILMDYAHERQAAHRSVPPLLWRLVTRFVDANNIADIETLLNSKNPADKHAAALVCYHTSYIPAKKLLSDKADLISAIQEKTLNWENIERQ